MTVVLLVCDQSWNSSHQFRKVFNFSTSIYLFFSFSFWFVKYVCISCIVSLIDD